MYNNNNISTLALEKKMDGVIKAINDKTEVSFHPLISEGMTLGVTKQIKQGSKINRIHTLIN